MTYLTSEDLNTTEAVAALKATTGPVCVCPMGCDMIVQVVKRDLMEMMATGYDDACRWLVVRHDDYTQVEFVGEQCGENG